MMASNYTLPVKRKTPTASKSWKDGVRQACFRRLRQQRRGPQSSRDSMRVFSARAALEQELTNRGIALISPCQEGVESVRRRLDPCVAASHFITEDELFELLQEVEDEMQRTESLHLEEMFSLQRDEEEFMQNQIADFEHWQESQDQTECGVLCPLCQECYVSFSSADTLLVCPNRMDGSCSFQIAASSQRPLETLKEQLQLLFDQHSTFCEHTLRFECIPTNDRAQIIATCSSCKRSAPLHSWQT
jgi:hypothetical protein